MAEWWVTCTGITQGPVTDGSGAGPYQTEAKARAAFQAGTRPPGCPDSSDPWWVEIIYSEINILQLNYPKVVQSKTKPTTGQKSTYIVTGVQGPFNTKAEAENAAKGYSGIINKGGVGSGGGTSSLGKIARSLGKIAHFFESLGKAHTWIRVGEVLLGVILIAVGIAKITNAVPLATDIAKTAAKVAVV